MRKPLKSNVTRKKRGKIQAKAGSERELAKLLGVSARTVRGWRTVEGAPTSDGAGRYDVREWLDWAAKHGKSAGEGAGTKSEWEVEKIKKQVEGMDLALRKRKGELVEVDDVKRWAAESAYAAKVELLSMPGKLAPQVVGLTIAEAEIRLRNAVNDALMHLHRETWRTK